MASRPNSESMKKPRFSQNPEDNPQLPPPIGEPDPAAVPTNPQGADEAAGGEASNDGVAAGSGADSRNSDIERAAYFLAEARGFEAGHELDDWLAAEQQVRLS